MSENKTKTESKSKDDNAMTDYIDLMIGSDGAFTFHGFGKLDGITIELPDKAINALAPALMSYIWQKKYWFPTHFTQKQRKALSAIAFGDIEMIVAGYREDGRRYREATELSKKLVEHDPKGFEAIREAVSAIKGSDGKVDPDMATPTLYMLLNQFIKRHTDVIGRKPDDLDMHFLRLPLTKKILVGEFIDDEFYECQEGSDDD